MSWSCLRLERRLNIDLSCTRRKDSDYGNGIRRYDGDYQWHCSNSIDCILTRELRFRILATFDIEYLFLNVRAKSVGETVDVNITCPDDGETNSETAIEIDTIKVQKTRGHKNIIKLDDDILDEACVILHSNSSCRK